MSAVPKFAGRVEPPTQFGRFSVFPRPSLGDFIVYDPARPFADRTVSVHKTKLEASDACRAASEAATARGESNERELKGLKWDWTDPRTWERKE